MENLKTIEQRLINIENRLLGIKTVLTFDEVAEYTGLSKSYMYKLTSAGLIPHYKPNGKQLFFQKSEIDLWLLRGAVKTNSDLDLEAEKYVTLKKSRG